MTGVLRARVAGNWVDVAGGGGDVHVGTDTPVGDEELWYDTDDPGAQSTLVANPNNALGIVAMGTFKSGLASPTVLDGAIKQLTEPIAITTLIGRRYRIVFQIRALNTVGAGSGSVSFMLYDGGVARPNLADYYALNTGVTPANSGSQWGVVLEGDGLAHSYAMWGRAWSLNGNAYFDSNCRYYIEDIGPTSSPALPIPTTPPAWTPVTFQNGWANYAPTSYTPAGYRKIGDEVSLRGLILKSTAVTAGEVITTLPMGFRPVVGLLCGVLNSSSSLTRIDVSAGGSVLCGTANAAGWGWVSLENIRFSVTS